MCNDKLNDDRDSIHAKRLKTPPASQPSFPRNRKAAKKGNKEKDRVQIAYDILLSCRSQDPVKDAHDPDIKQLPTHWVPTMISNISRAAQSFVSFRFDKDDSDRDSVENQSDTEVNPDPWTRQKHLVHAHKQSHTQNLLPRLSFRNPWPSYRSPGFKTIVAGLKWGLPEGYQEGGGRSRYRGERIRAQKKIQKQHVAAEKVGLGSDWDKVEVCKPDWGWPTEPKQQQDSHEASAKSLPTDQDSTFHLANGSTTQQEWRDPNNGNVNAARVTWLGHASVLLQLPPLNPAYEEEPVNGLPQEEEILSSLLLENGNVNPVNVKFDLERDLRKLLSGIHGLHRAESPDEEKSVRFMERGRNSNAASRSTSRVPSRNVSRGPSRALSRTNSRDTSNTTPPKKKPIPREHVAKRSINILFDPIFSGRCSPSQAAGPIRFTKIPCEIEDLPPIDIVCISHSHFDHLDLRTMKKIRSLRGEKVHAFVPLGLKDRLVSFGWDAQQVSELDWWDGAVIQVHERASSYEEDQQIHDTVLNPTVVATSDDAVESKLVSRIRQDRAKLRVICTPAQHGSGRNAGDKDLSLWASWVVEWIGPNDAAHPVTDKSGRAMFRAFFAGDTGLKYHRDSIEKRHRYPACPAFQEISCRIGSPDLLLLPISVGSSLSYFRSWDPFPRTISPFPRVSTALTSSIHMDAYDAVELHEIMRSTGLIKKVEKAEQDSKRFPISLAVHYGTFIRNHHQTAQDIRDLRKACSKWEVAFRRTQQGRFNRTCIFNNSTIEQNEKGIFLVSNQGETIWIPFEWETSINQ